MRPPRLRVLALVGALGVALGAGGCSGDHGGDPPATARLEVIVDANDGDGRRALDAATSAGHFVIDPSGDLLLAEDTAIRRVDARTGVITTVPGTELTTCADGASIEGPCGLYVYITALAVDRHGRIYFGVGDGRLLRVDGEGGAAEHVAGTVHVEETVFGCRAGAAIVGPADAVCFGSFTDLAFDRDGTLLIADNGHARIMRFDPAARVVTVVAGNGDGNGPCADDVPADRTCIGWVYRIAVDPEGGILIAIPSAPLRRIDPTTRLIHEIVGRANGCDGRVPGDGGPAGEACVVAAGAVAADDDGNVYVADIALNRIRRVDAATGIISTFDHSPTFSAADLALDEDGRVFVLGYTDHGGAEVRRFGAGPGSATVVAGSGTTACGDGGPARDACLEYPNDVAIGPDGALYVADAWAHRVRRIAGGIITTIAGDGRSVPPGDACPDGIPAVETCFDRPHAVAPGHAGEVYVLDGLPGFNRVRRVDRRGTIDTVVGGCRNWDDATTVPAADACLNIVGIAVADDGALRVAERSRVSRYDAAAGRLVPIVTAPSWCDEQADDPRPECFHALRIAHDGDGRLLVVEPTRLRRFDEASATLTLVAGNGTLGPCGDGGLATEACFLPGRVVPDAAGNLFLGAGGIVRRIDAATGIITTVAGLYDGYCHSSNGDVVQPDLGCASVHAIDAAGWLVYAEHSRTGGARVVRLDVPVGHPVP